MSYNQVNKADSLTIENLVNIKKKSMPIKGWMH